MTNDDFFGVSDLFLSVSDLDLIPLTLPAFNFMQCHVPPLEPLPRLVTNCPIHGDDCPHLPGFCPQAGGVVYDMRDVR